VNGAAADSGGGGPVLQDRETGKDSGQGHPGCVLGIKRKEGVTRRTSKTRGRGKDAFTQGRNRGR